jgi:hypothetical protein
VTQGALGRGRSESTPGVAFSPGLEKSRATQPYFSTRRRPEQLSDPDVKRVRQLDQGSQRDVLASFESSHVSDGHVQSLGQLGLSEPPLASKLRHAPPDIANHGGWSLGSHARDVAASEALSKIHLQVYLLASLVFERLRPC